MTITWGYVGTKPSTPPMVGYTEILRDPASDDIAIPVRLVRGPDAVVQRVRQRFQFFLGEWFLDRRLGIPYYEQVLVKRPDTGLIASLFRRVLVETPGVSRVATMSAEVEPRERNLKLTFKAFLEDPNVIIRAVDAPFKLR